MSEKVNDLAVALAEAQLEIKGAVKDSANPFFKSSYADLGSVWDAIRQPLTSHGLSIVQATDIRQGQVGVETILLHVSGQWIAGFLPLTMVKQDPQSQGSAMTYARRYALAAMVGVVQVDDDAEAAMPRVPAAEQERRPLRAVGESAPAQKPAATPAPKPGPKPKAAATTSKPTRTREELNRQLMNYYRPYLTKFPETQFARLLDDRYGVSETRLMTTEQLENLLSFMGERLGTIEDQSLRPGDFGFEGRSREPGEDDDK